MKINGDLLIGNTSTTLEDCIPHQRSIMTLTNSDAIYSVPNNAIVTFNTENHIGNKLTFSNSNRIVIGSGISKVLVSASVGVRYPATNDKKYAFSIIKNGAYIQGAGAYNQKKFNEPVSACIGGILIDVQEGDYIQLKTNFGATADITNDALYLTVEEIA